MWLALIPAETMFSSFYINPRIVSLLKNYFTGERGMNRWSTENLKGNGTLLCVRAQLFQLCPTLWYPTDCSSPGSSVHGILQARILGWVAISFSKGESPDTYLKLLIQTSGGIPLYFLQVLRIWVKIFPVIVQFHHFLFTNIRRRLMIIIKNFNSNTE